MPELKNEIPSSEELHLYFMEHLEHSPLSLDNSQYAPYTKNEPVNERERSVAELPSLGCGPFFSKARDAVLCSLHRLNELPRTDPFWHNTNNRPTIYKLGGFCSLVLEENPQDRLALWTLGALEVHDGSNDFGQRYWRRLNEIGDYDISLAVCAALVAEINVGGMSEKLAALLNESGRAREVKPLIESFRRSGSKRIVEWSRAVVEGLL